MAETYHADVPPGGYDPVQLALVAQYRGVAPDALLRDQLGHGVDYMEPGTSRPIEVAEPDPDLTPVVEGAPKPAGPLAVQIYCGDVGIHLVAGDSFRALRWVGSDRTPLPGELSRELGELRRLGTVALLGDPELVADRSRIQRWMAEVGVPTDHFTPMTTGLRTWWQQKLRIVAKELIVTSKSQRSWIARANPGMTFSHSDVPLVEGYGRKAKRI